MQPCIKGKKSISWSFPSIFPNLYSGSEKISIILKLNSRSSWTCMNLNLYKSDCQYIGTYNGVLWLVNIQNGCLWLVNWSLGLTEMFARVAPVKPQMWAPRLWPTQWRPRLGWRLLVRLSRLSLTPDQRFHWSTDSMKASYWLMSTHCWSSSPRPHPCA